MGRRNDLRIRGECAVCMGLIEVKASDVADGKRSLCPDCRRFCSSRFLISMEGAIDDFNRWQRSKGTASESQAIAELDATLAGR